MSDGTHLANTPFFYFLKNISYIFCWRRKSAKIDNKTINI